LGNGQSLTIDTLTIGHDAPATFTHTGGTGTVRRLVLLHSEATYQLSDTGELSVSEGHVRRGEFIQNGGTHVARNLEVFGPPVGDGTYRLTGGSLIFDRLQDDDGLWVGKSNYKGVFYLGDANGTGVLTDEPQDEGHGSLYVGYRTATTSDSIGEFRGWGSVDLSGELLNNGRIIADGYGTDRTLDLSQFQRVTQTLDEHGIENVVLADRTRAGWYAVNRGAIRLPPIQVSTGTDAYNWGEDADDASLDLVNSVRITLESISSGGPLEITLRASDYGVEPGPPNVDVIGMWDFSLSGSLSFDSAQLQFHYDDALAGTLGIDEEDLLVYQFRDNTWHALTGSVDPVNNVIIVSDLNVLTRFAVAGLGSKPGPECRVVGRLRAFLRRACGQDAGKSDGCRARRCRRARPRPALRIVGGR
jgi:hypothetical protein